MSVNEADEWYSVLSESVCRACSRPAGNLDRAGEHEREKATAPSLLDLECEEEENFPWPTLWTIHFPAAGLSEVLH